MKSNNYTIFSQQFNDISHPWRQKNREPLPTALYPISRYSGARYKGGSLYYSIFLNNYLNPIFPTFYTIAVLESLYEAIKQYLNTLHYSYRMQSRSCCTLAERPQRTPTGRPSHPTTSRAASPLTTSRAIHSESTCCTPYHSSFTRSSFCMFSATKCSDTWCDASR